jgi:hypothetical protein
MALEGQPAGEVQRGRDLLLTNGTSRTLRSAPTHPRFHSLGTSPLVSPYHHKPSLQTFVDISARRVARQLLAFAASSHFQLGKKSRIARSTMQNAVSSLRELVLPELPSTEKFNRTKPCAGTDFCHRQREPQTISAFFVVVSAAVPQGRHRSRL